MTPMTLSQPTSPNMHCSAPKHMVMQYCMLCCGALQQKTMCMSDFFIDLLPHLVSWQPINLNALPYKYFPGQTSLNGPRVGTEKCRCSSNKTASFKGCSHFHASLKQSEHNEATAKIFSALPYIKGKLYRFFSKHMF